MIQGFEHHHPVGTNIGATVAAATINYLMEQTGHIVFSVLLAWLRAYQIYRFHVKLDVFR